MGVRRRVANGEPIPKGYGVAWFDFAQRASVCYPMPLNWLMRWGREAYFRLRMPRRSSASERRQFEQYEAGRVLGRERGRAPAVEQFNLGYAAGWNACFEVVMEVIRQKFDEAAEQGFAPVPTDLGSSEARERVN